MLKYCNHDGDSIESVETLFEIGYFITLFSIADIRYYQPYGCVMYTIFQGVVSMKRVALLACVAACVSMFVFSCAKEPATELAAAKTAVEAARTALADKYVPAEFSETEAALKSAIAEIEKQKAANPLSRNYDKAKASLASVTATAGTLATKAAAEKAKVATEVESAVTALNAAIAEVKGLVAKAPKAKEAKALFEAKAKDVTALESDAAAIATLNANGDLISARDQASAANAKIEAIKAELNAELAKAPAPAVKGKKKK
jgi:hypothetical protein